MSVYILLTWFACILWTGLGYWISADKNVWIWGILAPLVIMFFMRAFVFLSLNDFDFLQDIYKLNKKIDKHNKEIDELEKNRLKLQ